MQSKRTNKTITNHKIYAKISPVELSTVNKAPDKLKQAQGHITSVTSRSDTAGQLSDTTFADGIERWQLRIGTQKRERLWNDTVATQTNDGTMTVGRIRIDVIHLLQRTELLSKCGILIRGAFGNGQCWLALLFGAVEGLQQRTRRRSLDDTLLTRVMHRTVHRATVVTIWAASTRETNWLSSATFSDDTFGRVAAIGALVEHVAAQFAVE